MNKFNFDEWMALAQNDPAAFEAKREAFLQSTINSHKSAETRSKLRALQRELDSVRLHSNTPMQALLELQKRMWVRFHELRTHMNVLTRIKL